MPEYARSVSRRIGRDECDDCGSTQASLAHPGHCLYCGGKVVSVTYVPEAELERVQEALRRIMDRGNPEDFRHGRAVLDA